MKSSKSGSGIGNEKKRKWKWECVEIRKCVSGNGIT